MTRLKTPEVGERYNPAHILFLAEARAILLALLMAAAFGAAEPAVVAPEPEGQRTVAPVIVAPRRRPLDDPRVARGQGLVRQRCVGCHSVEPSGLSLNAHAPPFRWMHGLAPQVLQRVALEIAAGDHAAMPAVVLTAGESEAISAFIRAYAKADAETQKAMSVSPCLARLC